MKIECDLKECVWNKGECTCSVKSIRLLGDEKDYSLTCDEYIETEKYMMERRQDRIVLNAFLGTTTSKDFFLIVTEAVEKVDKFMLEKFQKEWNEKANDYVNSVKRLDPEDEN